MNKKSEVEVTYTEREKKGRDDMKYKHVLFLIQAAVIAAIYAVLTLVLMPFSYGVMQVRISEALTILPYFTPAAIPGLFVGCLLANIIGPYGILDIVFGSLTTLIAAVGSYFFRKYPLLVPLPPVVANGVIIGLLLHYAFGVPVAIWACMLWVGFGEFISCYVLGLPLMRLLKKYEYIFK